MARSIVSGAATILAALGIDGLKVAVSFSTLGLNVANTAKDITVGSTTYTGLGKDGIIGDNIGENMLGSVPQSTLTIVRPDFGSHSSVVADSFRGDTATVILLYLSGGSWTASGWSTTYTVNADALSTGDIIIDLTSADATRGTEVPRRMTQEAGCQHDYKRGACSYRGALTTCDKTYNGPMGCKVHFPDITVNSETWVQTKPYGGFYGYVNRSVVARG